MLGDIGTNVLDRHWSSDHSPKISNEIELHSLNKEYDEEKWKMIPSSETKKIQIELLEEPPKAATMIHDLLALVLQSDRWIT